MIPNSKFSKICVKAILALLFAALAFLFIKSLSTVSIFAVRFKDIVHQRTLFYIFFSIVLMLIIFGIFKLIDKCSKKKLVIVTIVSFAIIISIQVFFSFYFNIHFVTDSFIVNDQSLAIAGGINKNIDTNNFYFHTISNNNFLVLFLVPIYKVINTLGISNYMGCMYLFNALMIDVSIYFVYRILVKCFSKSIATKYMILSVLNPINYLIIYWVYSATLSMPVMLAVIYLAISIWKTPDSKPMYNYLKIGGIALLSIVGFFLRPTVLIPVIAAVLCFILFGKIRGNLKQIGVSALVFIVISVISYAGINKFVYSYVTDTSGYFPITHYILLGMTDDGKFSADLVHKTASFKTKEEKQKYHIEEIKKEISKRGFAGMANLYLEKSTATWTEGSNAYTALSRDVADANSLYNWIFGEKSDLVLIYCQIFRIMCLLFTALFVLFQLFRRSYNYSFLVSLTMLGAIVFYMIWEAKECYSVPFLPLLLMMTCLGMDSSSDIIKKHLKINTKILLVPLLIIVELCTLFMGFTYVKDFTEKKYSTCRYSLFSYGFNWQEYVSDIASSQKTIKQTFNVSNDFNVIEFQTTKINNSNAPYSVVLKTNNKTVSKREIYPSYSKKNRLAFSVGKQKPKGKQKYSLIINSKSNKDSLGFAINNHTAIKRYDGTLTIDNKKPNGNLFLRAYTIDKKNIMAAWMYWLIIVLIMIAEFISFMILIKSITTLREE